MKKAPVFIRTGAFYKVIEERKMVEFDVKMKASDLYDYMLYHTYHGFSGIFGTLMGIFMIVGGIYTTKWVLVVAGIILLLYLPWTLFLKSRQQMLANPALKEPLHYVLDEEGVHVSQNGKEEMQKWEDLVRVVASNKSIFVYTSKVNACIFPRRDMGEYSKLVIQVLSTHLPAKKVKIRQ